MVQATSAAFGRTRERSCCWRAARAGDQEAREYLAHRALTLARAMLRKRPDLAHVREDLTQEAGLSLFGYLDRNEQPPRELAAFLRWRVLGVISTHQKGRRRPAPQPLAQELADRAFKDRPSQRLSCKDLGRIVSECRASLKPRHQEVLTLRYDQQVTTPEIAARMGARSSTVTVWLSRARKALAEALRRRGVGRADCD